VRSNGCARAKHCSAIPRGDTGATAASPLTITKTDPYPPERCVPVQVRGLRVYAPADTASMFVDAPQQACSALGEPTMSVGVVD